MSLTSLCRHSLPRSIPRAAVPLVGLLKSGMRTSTKRRLLTTLLTVFGIACTMATASAATITVPGMQPDIQSAINVSSPGDQILVAPGTFVVGTTINVTVANLTIQGSGISSTTLQVAQAVGNMFSVQAAGAGATIRDFKIQKTDVAGMHNIIWINANNVTVRDNEIFGPDPGTPWSVNGIVSRAIIVSPGLTGLLIEGNNIHHLRQPAYIDGPPGVMRGSILNNNVSGTRGWVLDGAKLVISGNTWGPPENQGAEIALINTSTPVDYPNLIALSNANSNAYISAQWVGGENGRATAYVDDSAAPGGFGSVSAPYSTIGAGVANTLTDGTVQVAAGSYTEQVVVSKNMSVLGAGRASTFIVSPALLTTQFTTSGPNKPVVFVQNATNVSIRDLTVDANGAGNANNRIQGVAFWNAGGKLLDCDVLRVRNTPLDGVQAGVGVFGGTNTVAYSLEVGGTNILDFQKNGTAFTGAGYTVNFHDCTVTGAGPTGVTAQNGVQYSGGASGTVTNCAVSGVYYTGPTWTATGQLFFGPGTVNVTGGSVNGCQSGTYYIDASGQMTGTNTTTPVGGGIGAFGIVVYNQSSTLAQAARTGGASARPVAQPYDAVESALIGSSNATASLITVTVDGGCLTGPGSGPSEGIEAYTEGGGLVLNVTNMEISNWGYGIFADGTSGASSVNANHNSITANVYAGFMHGGLGSHSAEDNWWGNASGPGVGGANPAVGSVDYTPWLIAGTDNNAGCGFAPPADNAVTPVPPVACVTPANPCVDVPVNISRTNSTGMRAFSVDIQLSAGLTLCAAVDEGTYLSSIGGTQFQVLSNGGGSYTIDGSILGLPCGATAPTGTLFTLHVGSLLPSATGTVTVTSVILRDCANAPIAGSPGTAASVSIDNTAPSGIAGLAASQQVSGNDADGTTKVNLSWPAVEVGASVEVWRKGFGSHPEYDDAGGSTPASPGAYPPAGWTLAGTVTGVTSYADETTARDFYYYVAYVKDACGNYSAVSNRTNGTLNYHLGDVQPVALLRGNNLVNTADVSDLGFNYGATLVLSDPLNYLDVGPTTDFSTSARPTTDNKVQFEDLMMFAINYGQVSAPNLAARPAGKEGADQLELSVPELPAVGETFAVGVRLSTAGTVKGVSVQLAFDPSVVEPVGVEAGELLAAQHLPSVVLSSGPGNLDAVVLGEGQTIRGAGELARATFRVRAAGDAALRMSGAVARDRDNRTLELGILSGPGTGALPARTALGPVFPNPVRLEATIELSLREETKVSLDVFDLTGRRVATLLNGTQPAGVRLVRWDGRGEQGARLAPGIYMLRLEAGALKQSRRVMLVH